MQMEKIERLDLEKLLGFTVKAKRSLYSTIESDKQLYDTTIFSEEDLSLVTLYKSNFWGEGKEVLTVRDIPVWQMNCHGGVTPEFKRSYEFLKYSNDAMRRALSGVNEQNPIRGPSSSYGLWNYSLNLQGDFREFRAEEKLLHEDHVIFEHTLTGGIIKQKW